MFFNLSTLQLTCQDTNARGEGKHESDHDSGEVNGADSIEDDEDAFVVDILDAVPQSNRKHAYQDVEIEEEGEQYESKGKSELKHEVSGNN